MSVDAACPRHAPAPAEWTCGRCGTFFCEACAFRVRPDARPMCETCWNLRAQTVKPQHASRGGKLQTAGLVLGVFGLVPNGIFQLLAGVICVLGLLIANDEDARKARWKPAVGLVMTAIGCAIFFWFVIGMGP